MAPAAVIHPNVKLLNIVINKMMIFLHGDALRTAHDELMRLKLLSKIAGIYTADFVSRCKTIWLACNCGEFIHHTVIFLKLIHSTR